MVASPKPNELYITRIYDAPVDVVWDAWVDPAQAAKWWGPRGFTLTTHSKELKPGGVWHYTMHGPDGVDYINKTLYHEVETGRKLIYDHGGNDEQDPLFRVTVYFTPVGDNQTKMEMTMALKTAEEAAATRKFIKEVGGNSTWDRLAEYLGKMTEQRDVFVINRSFEAPRETVFEMWTKPEHFAKWLPPTGFEMEFRDVEVRPGKTAFYKMANQAGITMFGRIAYREIDSPCRLVYTQQFCDEAGNLSHHPKLPVWPPTMLTTVLFAEEGENATRVTVVWEPEGEATAEAIQAFLDLRSGMAMGWTGSFDKLEALLSGEAAAH